ncbi:MAG TPA: hypothetical protein VFQ63_00245 [Patescibacteria group bacterium]|nr:hypothetical protein [Patescibacteria group bacterium]
MTKLLFVYNANSSLFNQLGDLIHKTVSPRTYPCRLCGLTYSGVSMKREWKEFIEALPFQSAFLHKDEFVKKYLTFSNTPLPAVFLEKGNSLTLFLNAQEINKLQTLNELKDVVESKVNNEQ